MIKNKTIDVKIIFKIYLKILKYIKNILDFHTNFCSKNIRKLL